MYCDVPVLGRCCFCMPLRRGIITFGYINLVMSAFMVGIFSYAVHVANPNLVLYRGIALHLPSTVCITLHCIEILFNVILIYGAHKEQMQPIKVYYYFSISTILASLLLQIIDFTNIYHSGYALFLIEGIPVLLASTTVQIYLILLIRSLLRKLEQSGPHMYENQLQQIVYEGKVKSNGVYDDTVLPVDV